MSTHGFAQMLETLCQLLRDLPDEGLSALLQHLRFLHEEQRRRREFHPVRTLLPPPRDPRQMDRGELTAYLQSPQYFPHKADLLEFARRYEVPVNARTPREEIVRLCLRMIHDIPTGATILRLLAQQHASFMPGNLNSVGH
jgi:hypothetical protein